MWITPSSAAKIQLGHISFGANLGKNLSLFSSKVSQKPCLLIRKVQNNFFLLNTGASPGWIVAHKVYFFLSQLKALGFSLMVLISLTVTFAFSSHDLSANSHTLAAFSPNCTLLSLFQLSQL